MKTLLNLEPPSLHIPKTPPWNQRNPIRHGKSLKHPIPNLHLGSWRLHAEAKGFNRARADHLPRQKDREENIYEGNNRNDEDDDKIPEVVWDRMIGRILFYVGFPLASGFALLQVFSVIKENNLLDVPNWLPYLTTFITFGASTLGIAYGTLSTSLEPEKMGSPLGFEEVQKNWVDMWKEEEEEEEEEDSS